MRRLPSASPLLLVLLLSACGDDGKTAPTGPPSAPPAAPPGPGSEALPPAPIPPPAPSAPSPAPAAPPPPDPASTRRSFAASTWAGVSVDDWVTWEIRVAGSDLVTRLTWRATAVDAAGVTYTSTAKTLAVDGTLVSSVETTERHAAGDAPASGEPERVAGAAWELDTLRSTRRDASGEITTWIADAIPFSGIVRARGPSVEQTLVTWLRSR